MKNVLLISGKRKSGKDFVAEKLQKRLGRRCQIVRISEPIKTEWAQKLNLNLDELLSDGAYKEKYRHDMIVWSDEVRAVDYGHFCRSAMRQANAEIIIVSDIRRRGDVKFFLETYGPYVRTMRLTCPEQVRAERGWIYTVGVDDVQSECGLDDYEPWDLVLENNHQMDEEQMIDLIIAKFNF